MWSDIAAILTKSRTWYLLAAQDISLRYRRSILGPFWISIAMASLVLAIGLLFSEIQNQPFKEFLTFFGCGLLAWTFLSTVLNEGCTVVTDAEGYLRSIRLALPLLAARMVARNASIFAHNALVIVGMLVIFGNPLTITALWAIPGVALIAVFGVFAAVALGPICARFRDVPQVISSVMQVVFFLTPIFWVPTSNLSRPIVVEANPFYHLIQLVRAPMMGELPSTTSWYVALACTAAIGLLALMSLALTRKRVFLWL